MSATNRPVKQSVVLIEPHPVSFMKKLFDAQLKAMKNDTYSAFSSEERYAEMVDRVMAAKSNGSRDDYYDVVVKDGQKTLIRSQHQNYDPVKLVVRYDQMFDILHAVHIKYKHCGRTRMEDVIFRKYRNIDVDVILTYLRLCGTCNLRRCQEGPRRNSVPTAHVGLIDMQGARDGQYVHIMVYHDVVDKFVWLRPLRTDSGTEVVGHLFEIFDQYGAPTVLRAGLGVQLPQGGDVDKLTDRWIYLKIVRGRRSYKPGKPYRMLMEIERVVQDWMERDRSTEWSTCLGFYQYDKDVEEIDWNRHRTSTA